ncbi:BrnA antitoxin family protein [Ferrovum sp.]|uniref:BrnA antitoxin family protein n=1 Tax=Ferrovum sp. TaxID=2609467 RepID=UPI002633A4C0|nr:BrnA antitoxin family protein [Ferrovum sp.]
MSKIVRYEVDLNNPPPLTAEQKAELKALAEMPDESIDYSDIPPLDEEFWKQAVRNPFYKPTKTSTTVRVDSDVLLWLKSKGKGYQTRLNEILRKAMIDEIEEAHDH